MIAFLFKSKDGLELQINFCEEGLYISLDDEGDQFGFQNLIIDTDQANELIDFLNYNKNG
jgi:hypothetical protein